MATIKTYEVTIIEDGRRSPVQKVQAITSYHAAKTASGCRVKRFIGRDGRCHSVFIMDGDIMVFVVEV